MKNKIVGITIAVLTAVILLLECYVTYKETGEVDKSKIEEAVSTVVKEINKSTTEIPELSEEDEQTLEVQETENESFELQGNIAYESGDNSNDFDVELGQYAGLTYYSQIDNRWKNKQYTSIGNPNQTIGTSGCGPTSAAMVVSSIKGTITPDIMADLFVANGYRSANNGTYWSAFRYVADKWNIGYTETTNIQNAVQLINDKNYVICSVANGLFTTGGHFIVLTGVEGNYIKVYDPYLYSGKFETSTRRGKATVSGNTVYVSIENFKQYANYQRFFCFKNDRTDIKENTTTTVITNNSISNIQNVNYKVKIIANSGLNIRAGTSTSYRRIGGYSKNQIVTILSESNGWGKTDKGWISLVYTSRINNIASTQKISEYTTGTYKVNCSKLNVRTGPSTKYRIKSLRELTKSARKQGGYVRGVKCTVTKVIGNWGVTPSGYICLDYCKKIR